VKVNQLKDFIERVGWTALQAGVGFALASWQGGPLDSTFWNGLLYAVGIAALKVIAAQQVGTRGSGDAIPGGVEK
jgi:hypothetical protein